MGNVKVLPGHDRFCSPYSRDLGYIKNGEHFDFDCDCALIREVRKDERKKVKKALKAKKHATH